MKDIKLPFKFWLGLILAFLIVYAFLVGFWYPKDTMLVSPEMSWIFPRVILLSVVALIGLLQAKNLKSYINPFSILILAQLLFAVLSTLIINDDLQFKLFGPDRRMDGLFYQMGLAFFALLIYRIALLKDITKPLFLTLFGIGVIQVFIVVAQKLGLDVYSILLPTNRINGSFGHYGFVAGFLLLPICTSFYLYSTAKAKLQTVFALGMLAMVFALGLTTTRSAYLALIAVLPFFFLLQRNLKTFVLLCMMAILPFQATKFLPSPEGTQIQADRKVTDTTTINTRLAFWQLSRKVISVIPGMPFIGGGPDALRLAIINEIPPEDYAAILKLEYSWPADTEVESIEVLREEGSPPRTQMLLIMFSNWSGGGKEGKMYGYDLDKAHNFIIDRILAYGFINALIWIVLYVSPLIFALKTKKLELKVVALSILSFSIYYQGWFPVVPVEPFHITIIALAWALYAKQNQKLKNNDNNNSPRSQEALL